MSNSPGKSTRLDIVSIDLVLIELLGVWLILSTTVELGDFPARAIVGVVAVIFAPGYALVSALFPKQNANEGSFTDIRAEVTGVDGRITVVERLLLSVALSVCLVPLFGLGLGLLQMEIQTSTSMGAVGIMTVSLTLVAFIRRRQVQPRERFDPKIGAFLRSVLAQRQNQKSPLVVLLVTGFVIAGGGIGVAVLDADRGEDFTEFSLLTEDPETGELVADQYPEELTENGSEQIHVEITNNEGETIEYSVVVLLQSFDEAGQIQATETLDRFRTTVRPNETRREQRTVQPELTGEDLRLTYLLYIDSPPEGEPPSTEDAYRQIHIWVDVPTQ